MEFNQTCSNLSIKIVPSMEDSLKLMGLDVDLDDFCNAWFKQLKITWKTWKNSPAIENHIEAFFSVYIRSISCWKWSLCSGVLPEDHLKLPAFHIAMQQRNQYFLALVVKTYHIVTIKEKILPIVKDMIKNDNSKQASQIVVAMQLFEDIPVEDLMFPLILQDKSNLVDDYLSECPSQVKPLLLFLDKLLDKKISSRQFIQTYIEDNKISHVKYDKVHHKPLGKLVARLCNKYNIPIETCKNLSKNRITGGLRYLIYQKYQEHNVSSSVWEDLVKDSLRQNASSGQEFIDILIDYDLNEARKWATYLNMPDNLLPLALKDISLNDAPEEEMWDTNVDTSRGFYKLTLTENQIAFVDTGEKFYDLLMSDVVKSSVVSIDCEWKPSFGATQSQVALIQIATIDKIYLIDALVLNKSEYSSFWCSFYKSFLDNAEIIKVGFGLEQDLKEMKSTVVGLSNIKIQGEGLLDLGILWKSLLSNGLTLPSNSDNGGNSLSSLVESCFGLPLEKSEQCSNWELRPLRNTQVMYAALDAYVLLQIYEFLEKLCVEQHINFEEICNDVMLESKKKCSKKHKVIERLQSNLSVGQSRPAHEVKLLVDHVLCNLMPYLRYCGIDTIVIPHQMLWHDVIKLAISEDRFIILSKMKCTPTQNYPQNFILEVTKNNLYKQLRKVLNCFCINVDQENLFKFCINCNSQNLTKLSAEEVTKICNQYLVETERNDHPSRYEHYDDDENGYHDGFLSDSDGEEDQPHIYQTPKTPKLKTNMGYPIEIHNACKLVTLNRPGILCEECGKLFWNEDLLYMQISQVVSQLKDLKLW